VCKGFVGGVVGVRIVLGVKRAMPAMGGERRKRAVRIRILEPPWTRSGEMHPASHPISLLPAWPASRTAHPRRTADMQKDATRGVLPYTQS
jgi:hypothetical protein